MEKITIDKKALADLIRVKEEFDLIVESLELMGDKEFIESYEKAKKEIKEGDLIEFDDL